ncbi:Vps24 protein [Candida orthopsilosis Co 90-125]|uniref:Vps24 protein n=1 Tax=Candida orthopsilosis (strain 90-125) TaxID=1136231 RepID=H8WYX4_CANO9|nr:Vps24 protein [Candida orthopsilosis Co 90-125]CCG21606.1 Vps24 protein [Candida orthopsilosis Co 90-125]
MDYIKKQIWGPDPKEQMRKINQLLRKNKRELDRSINQLQPLKKKTEGLIRKSAKEKDYKTAKLYAKELININRQYNKLYTSRTRVESITMSINEQYSMNKLTKSIHSSTSIMRDVNSLIHIGAVSQTMQELSKELTKAGIINEMMDDMVDLDYEEDEELESESQEEVNKIIATLTEEKTSKVSEVPTTQLEAPHIEEEVPVTEEEDEEDTIAIDEIKQRLRALQS